METTVSRRDVIAALTKSPHGDLKQYVPVARAAVLSDPDFYAHLIAWNQRKGEIRDSKVALPVIALMTDPAIPSGYRSADPEYRENALAALALSSPRDLIRGIEFAKQVGILGHRDHLRRMVERYLRDRESNYAIWERTALQHRDSMLRLYKMYRVKPIGFADAILFKREFATGTVFDVLRRLKDMSPVEIAAEIVGKKIPFLIASGALGEKAKNPDVLMALIERMTPTELVTNMKRLEKLGVRNVPALRAALEEGLKKAASSTKNVLKTSVAMEAIDDEVLKTKMAVLQEKQIAKHVGIDGDWLVLADKSGSMQQAIEAARHVAAALAGFVKGTVHLVFFDTEAYGMDVTGHDYAKILKRTERIIPGGGTAIGIGLKGIMERNVEVDGIAIVSDGGEYGNPAFAQTYPKYVDKTGKEPAVYFYQTDGEADRLTGECRAAGIDMQTFDLRGTKGDYYSLPGLVQTMRISRTSLIQEILDTPLFTLDAVLKRTVGKEEVCA